MDLTFSPAQEAFRADARRWLADHVPERSLASFDTAEGFERHRRWERTMFDARWSVVSWPQEFGGRGADLIEWLIFEEEYYRARAPRRVNQNGVFLVGPTLMQFGTAEQKARFLPRIASGDDIWCQGWSEPNAGSDLASIRSTAVLRGDAYVLNGQKTWCSRGVYADWLFGIFRTNSDDRHGGLTSFLVPMRAPGIRVRPIVQLDGEPGFAEVFFEDVTVPADQRLGPDGGGWSVAMATAGSERGISLRSPARFSETAQRLVELYRKGGGPSFRHEVAQAWMDAEAYKLHTYWTVSHLLAGGTMGAEASLNKLFWSEMDLRLHDVGLRLIGGSAELTGEASEAIDRGEWMEDFLFAQAGPIYAGTNEIQRNIIADRLLGLPKGSQ
jgi:alkylation response protein AidB-like acyl-CoA dehydrogenase